MRRGEVRSGGKRIAVDWREEKNIRWETEGDEKRGKESRRGNRSG
jgi:hypothetical protein